MKYIVKTIFALMFLIVSRCHSQQLVKTAKDAKKLKDSSQLFINKPLKTLLKEIGPQIKWVNATNSKDVNSLLGYFIFKFVDSKKNDSIKAKGKTPVTIVAFVKEYFDWDFQKRLTEKRLAWTNEDLGTYGNLTVVDIRVYGKE